MVYRNLSYVSHLKQETFWFIETTHDQRLYLFYMMLHLYTHPLFPLTPASTFSMHWFRQTVELTTTTRGPGRNSLLCFDNIVIELNPGTLPLVSRDQCPKSLLYSNKDNMDRQQFFYLQSVGQTQCRFLSYWPLLKSMLFSIQIKRNQLVW